MDDAATEPPVSGIGAAPAGSATRATDSNVGAESGAGADGPRRCSTPTAPTATSASRSEGLSRRGRSTRSGPDDNIAVSAAPVSSTTRISCEMTPIGASVRISWRSGRAAAVMDSGAACAASERWIAWSKVSDIGRSACNSGGARSCHAGGPSDRTGEAAADCDSGTRRTGERSLASGVLQNCHHAISVVSGLSRLCSADVCSPLAIRSCAC